MSVPIMSYSIYYNVNGARDFISKLRTFAMSVGWTVDEWGGATYGANLRLYSPGFASQGLLFNFTSANIDGTHDVIIRKAIDPVYRADPDPVSHYWGPGSSDNQCSISFPATSIDTVYFFGNSWFITCISRVSPTNFITIAFGTINLYQSWKGYANNLIFAFIPQTYGTSDQYKWSTMGTNPNYWIPTYTYRGVGSSGYYPVYWWGDKRDYHYVSNNAVISYSGTYGSESGHHNVIKELLSYNSYTDKRFAVCPVFFALDTTLGVWYPVGTLPLAYINSTGLVPGQTLTFGTDSYIVLPLVFQSSYCWQAIRIS